MNFDEQALKALEIQHWQFGETTEPMIGSTIETRSDLSQLEAQVEACQLCPLSKARTHPVFGEGSAQAEIMFVGEAPGMHEDRQGRPFVGRAGLLLNEMLKAMGLDRQAVFIANVLKCRPPQNRDPNIHEVETCTPYLVQQIDLIQPKVIVALGRHAAHYLLNTEQALGRLRSKWHSYHDHALLVTYHPAYLLRNPRDKRKAWDDLCMLKEKLTQATPCLS